MPKQVDVKWDGVINQQITILISLITLKFDAPKTPRLNPSRP